MPKLPAIQYPRPSGVAAIPTNGVSTPVPAAAPKKAQSYIPLPKFPEAWRDIAMVVPDAITSAQVISAVEEKGKPHLKQIELFDLYRGKNLPEGVRSLAYRLRFQADDKTLTDKEVSDKMAQIVELLKERYSIALR